MSQSQRLANDTEMKNTFFLLLFSVILNLNAQTYRGDYDEWTIAFSAGVNKPYNTMTPGYTTSNPNFYHIELGTRYTINPYIGIKADIGYDKFKNKTNTTKFESNYMRVNLQAVTDVGYVLALYNSADPIGILFHAGAGVSQLSDDQNIAKDRMVNLIYGFTGTFTLSRNISLSGDISSLIHAKQSTNFDAISNVKSPSTFNSNLLTSSVGIIYFFRK